jgi:hypothetical protein
MSETKLSISKCFREMIKNEGTKSLYRGVMSPVIGCMPYNAVIFSSYSASMRTLNDQGLFSHNWNISIAGALSGTFALIVFVPLELLKV